MHAITMNQLPKMTEHASTKIAKDVRMYGLVISTLRPIRTMAHVNTSPAWVARTRMRAITMKMRCTMMARVISQVASTRVAPMLRRAIMIQKLSLKMGHAITAVAWVVPMCKRIIMIPKPPRTMGLVNTSAV